MLDKHILHQCPYPDQTSHRQDQILNSQNLSFLAPLSINFFDHILRPLLEESFDPSCPPKLPTEPLKVDFGTFVGPFWGSEWILGDQSRP